MSAIVFLGGFSVWRLWYNYKIHALLSNLSLRLIPFSLKWIFRFKNLINFSQLQYSQQNKSDFISIVWSDHWMNYYCIFYYKFHNISSKVASLLPFSLSFSLSLHFCLDLPNHVTSCIYVVEMLWKITMVYVLYRRPHNVVIQHFGFVHLFWMNMSSWVCVFVSEFVCLDLSVCMSVFSSI